MFWKRRVLKESREKPDRRELMARLELRLEPHAAPILRRVLDLDGRLELEPVYNLPLDAGAELYVLDYDSQGPGARGVRPGWTTSLLVLTRMPVSSLSLRVGRKRSEVLESLGAAAAGGRRVMLPGDDAFNERLSLYARDEAGAAAAMTPPVRTRLLRALDRQAEDISFSLGEKQLLFSVRSEGGASDAVIGALLEDLLSLYALFRRTP